MRLVIMCVRDIKAGAFGNPFFVSSVGQAERSFSDEINRVAEDNTMYKHPEDFELFELGSFETDTATMQLFERPLQRMVGSSCVRPNNVRKLEAV